MYDKWSGESYKATIRKVACQHDFYNIKLEGTTFSMEPSLADLEDRTSHIVDKIILDERLDILTSEERSTLSTFCAIQKCRIQSFLDQWRYLHGKAKEALQSKGFDSAAFPKLEDLCEDDIRKETLLFIVQAIKEFAPHYLNKSWVLYKAPKAHPFYISDCPITLQNTLNRNPFYGTIGLAVPGIEIHLPLSPTICLALLCPTIEAMLVAKAKAGSSPIVNADTVQLNDFIKGFGGRKPIPLWPQNVTNLNYLQVVYSVNGEFALAERVIKHNPEYKRGIKPQIV